VKTLCYIEVSVMTADDSLSVCLMHCVNIMHS